MIQVRHDWDEEDYVASLESSFKEYVFAYYGSRPLPLAQLVEIRQAFFSGIHWLATRDSYCPDDLDAALRKLLGLVEDGNAL